MKKYRFKMMGNAVNLQSTQILRDTMYLFYSNTQNHPTCRDCTLPELDSDLKQLVRLRKMSQATRSYIYGLASLT